MLFSSERLGTCTLGGLWGRLIFTHVEREGISVDKEREESTNATLHCETYERDHLTFEVVEREFSV